MIEGGVQKPNGLGMQYGGKTAESGVPNAALQSLQDRLDEMTRELRTANDMLTEIRGTAAILWRSLWVMAQWYRATGEVTEEDVELALLPLIEHAELGEPGKPPTLSCPECAGGKHPNCTGQVLNTADEMVACACEMAEHLS